MNRKYIATLLVIIVTVGAEVQAAEHRAAATESANRQAAVQLVSDGSTAGTPSKPAEHDISTLENLEFPPSDLPPGFTTLNLTQLAPLIPLLGGLNATVLASWTPVVERTPAESLALAVPALNALNASTLEALLAALPYLNWETVIAVLPLVNELPAATLTSYINLLTDIPPEFLAALVPGIVQLDPVWVNKVVPAVLKAFDADYLIRLVNAIAPTLSQTNPDLIVALLPAINTISLKTWQLLIEILNAFTVPMLQLLVHLLTVFGPLLDKMSRILNIKRRILPVDVSNYMGKVTKFTKPPGTLGMQPSSIIFGRKVIPGSEPNNGAPPAPLPPPVPALPRTLNSTNSTASPVRSLLSFMLL